MYTVDNRDYNDFNRSARSEVGLHYALVFGREPAEKDYEDILNNAARSHTLFRATDRIL